MNASLMQKVRFDDRMTLHQKPYAPSWYDRLTALADALPVPTWTLYGAAWLLIFGLYTTLKAWYGANPLGSFTTLDVLMTGTGLYLLALMHYLDNTAGKALAAFRPVLAVDEDGFAELAFRLTTLPSRRTLLVTLLVGIWLGPSFIYTYPAFSTLKLGMSPLLLCLETALFCFVWGMAGTFVYHTIHQLRLVSQIYTRHTHVNLYRLGPLYAFSRLTARTAIGITVVNYAWAVPLPETGLPPAGADTTIFFALFALIAFLWPLLGAHRVLADEKQRLQGETAQRLADAFGEVERGLETQSLEGVGNIKTAVDTLLAKQSVLAKISTWPWQIDTMRGLLAALSLPVMIWAIQRLLDLFLFSS